MTAYKSIGCLISFLVNVERSLVFFNIRIYNIVDVRRWKCFVKPAVWIKYSYLSPHFAIFDSINCIYMAKYYAFVWRNAFCSSGMDDIYSGKKTALDKIVKITSFLTYFTKIYTPTYHFPVVLAMCRSKKIEEWIFLKKDHFAKCSLSFEIPWIKKH